MTINVNNQHTVRLKLNSKTVSNRKKCSRPHPQLRLYDPVARCNVINNQQQKKHRQLFCSRALQAKCSIHSISYILQRKEIKWNVVYLMTPTSYVAAANAPHNPVEGRSHRDAIMFIRYFMLKLHFAASFQQSAQQQFNLLANPVDHMTLNDRTSYDLTHNMSLISHAQFDQFLFSSRCFTLHELFIGKRIE